MEQLNKSAGHSTSSASEATTGKQAPRARDEHKRGDRENLYRWLDAREARERAWQARKNAGQRPGPIHDRWSSWERPRQRTAHFVVVDSTLPPGYPVRFAGDSAHYVVGPNGATMEGRAISKPLYSRGQARKALRTAARRYPMARLQTCSWLPDCAGADLFMGGRLSLAQVVKVDAV
jgi:hypothetical protein